MRPVLWQYFKTTCNVLVLALQVCLTRCPGCNRTFTDEAMEHHRNSCKALPEGRIGGAGMLTGGAGFTSKPRGYSCYLCGQQYGSASLKIHIPQCRVRPRSSAA